VRHLERKLSAERVLIVGAGLGGLTAALAMLQRGLEVEVYEQSQELAPVGAGIQLGPNGMRILDSLGVTSKLAESWVLADGKELRLWNTGQRWPVFDLGQVSVSRYGHPYIMIHRAELHAVLVAAVRALKPDAIRLGCEVRTCDQTGGEVRLHLAGGGVRVGSVLVGADGVHSVVRRALFGDDAQPEFSGYVAWRGIVPSASLPAELRRPVMTSWIGPGGHIVQYLVRRGELLNFVAVTERSEWIAESWTQTGDPLQCAADFAGWHGHVRTMLGRAVVLTRSALMSREPMRRWSAGRCTLLGDACHPSLPFLAQGANMAIEDAAVLALCLTAAGADVAAALARYEALRIDRTTEVMRQSAENGQRSHSMILSRAEEAGAYIDAQWGNAKVEERYDWLYRYDALSVL